MGPSQPVRGGIDIETLAPPVAVDHRIKLLNYFRIADALLTQANIYREEKNLLELYVILLRYSRLLCETIPKHRDYRQFKSREKEFFKKKLLDVVNELELLKPVVRQQITELNRGGTMEPHSLNGAYDATHRTEQHTSRSRTPQPLVGCATGSLQKFGRHQAASLPSVQPDRQIPKQYANLSYPKEEALSRHSILGPDGLSGQCAGTVAGIKVQYPMNIELTQSDIASLVPAILNHDDPHGCSTASQYGPRNNSDRQWSVPVEGSTSVSSAGLEEELPQWNIRQPSPPLALSHVRLERIPKPTTQGLAISDTSPYRTVYVPEELTGCFLKVAEANTVKSLETCGIIAGTILVNQNVEYFVATALIIPKQKSTSNTCEATNEEEILEVFQHMESPSYLGWIHTHPTQDCFMSSVDLHNHYSYQMELPEAFAIVMAPSRGEHNVFHLTVPGGMDEIGDCSEREFHPHDMTTYEECSHVKWYSDLAFDVFDLRER